MFPKQLGLDARITSWDPKNRIPREQLSIYIYVYYTLKLSGL